MVSKSVTVLSFLMPIAMVIGTGIAIEFSRYSSLNLLILSAFAGLMGCVHIMIKRSQPQGFLYEQNKVQLVTTK